MSVESSPVKDSNKISFSIVFKLVSANFLKSDSSLAHHVDSNRSIRNVGFVGVQSISIKITLGAINTVLSNNFFLSKLVNQVILHKRSSLDLCLSTRS